MFEVFVVISNYSFRCIRVQERSRTGPGVAGSGCSCVEVENMRPQGSGNMLQE